MAAFSAVTFTIGRLPFPVDGTLAPGDRLAIQTLGWRGVLWSTANVVLSCLLDSTGTYALTAGPNALPPALVQVTTEDRGVGILLDTTAAWSAGDGLSSASPRVTAYSLAGPVVVAPPAFISVSQNGAQAIVRLGSAAAPPVAQTVYRLSLALLSRAGVMRVVPLCTVLCRA
jgi:hypothetical protein